MFDAWLGYMTNGASGSANSAHKGLSSRNGLQARPLASSIAKTADPAEHFNKEDCENFLVFEARLLDEARLTIGSHSFYLMRHTGCQANLSRQARATQFHLSMTIGAAREPGCGVYQARAFIRKSHGRARRRIVTNVTIEEQADGNCTRSIEIHDD